MKFAILGTDWESISLAEAAIAAGHEVVWCGDITIFEIRMSDSPTRWSGQQNLSQEMLPWLPGEDRGENWEELLDSHNIEAVIVGRGAASPQLRVEQVTQLLKNDVPVLATFPLVDSVLAFYEIDMSRSESGTVLHHFNPLVACESLVGQWAEWVRNGHPQIGLVEQIVWERPLPERTRQSVLWQFTRDVELLGQVAGRLNRIGAHGSPDEDATYSSLSVQLLGESKKPVRWEVGPMERSAWPRLLLVGQEGKLTVEFNESGQAMQLEVSQGGDAQTSPFEETDLFANAVNRFTTAIETHDATSSTWLSALHAMDLTDTIEISLRRGRMIDVHQQQLTEQLSFKGTMSAVGCAVLMVLPPLLLFLGWLAEQIGLPIAEYWPHALLALLAIFLLFQILPRLLLKPPSEE